MTDTIEELIIYNHKKKRQLTSVFLVPSTTVWQANIRHKEGNGAYDYGQGDTPTAAVKDATERADGKFGRDNRPLHAPVKGAPEPVESKLENASLADMLG